VARPLVERFAPVVPRPSLPVGVEVADALGAMLPQVGPWHTSHACASNSSRHARTLCIVTQYACFKSRTKSRSRVILALQRAITTKAAEVVAWVSVREQTSPRGPGKDLAPGPANALAEPPSSFIYDDAWRTRRGAFALAPSLPLGRGQFHSDRPLFICFTDAAPDSWGKKLMRRHERARAEDQGGEPRTLFDVDFLAGVDDRTRIGAMRFKDPSGDAFLTTRGEPVPPLIDLPALLGATDRIDRGRETNSDIALVLAPGTSLGGARPKATIRDRRLLVAKFSKRDDEWPVTRWQATTLALAMTAGVTVPDWRLETVARKAVLLLGRFDRTAANGRIPYMSAMTALDATDHGEQRSYLELADVV
jgi:hypothetical protein